MQGQPGNNGFSKRTFLEEHSSYFVEDERTPSGIRMVASTSAPQHPSAQAPVQNISNPPMPQSSYPQQHVQTLNQGAASVQPFDRSIHIGGIQASPSATAGQRCGLSGTSTTDHNGYVRNLFSLKRPRISPPPDGQEESTVEDAQVTSSQSSQALSEASSATAGTSDESSQPDQTEPDISFFSASSSTIATQAAHSWPRNEDVANRPSIMRLWKSFPDGFSGSD